MVCSIVVYDEGVDLIWMSLKLNDLYISSEVDEYSKYVSSSCYHLSSILFE